MSQEPRKYGNVLRYAGLGMQMMVMLSLAVWLGLKSDRLVGWKFPVFLILFPVLALAVSLWQLIKTLNKPPK